MPPHVGQVVNNKYRLLRHIGDGGMGSVYEARHETLGTTVALKFLHLEFTRREGLVQRFLQEARASAQIQSPHVIRVSDVDQTADNEVFIVLEYLEGKTLQALYEELYRAGRRLSYAEALDYAEQMLDGVQAAHDAGIIHRDLKPDNVMITVDGRGATVLKLLDFGIAKLKVIGAKQSPGLTRPGVMMGTPEYMAPEQASSADTVDARADVFSLGVIIFEMLGGQRPVGGDDPYELAVAYKSGHISQLAELTPGIAPELSAAVHRAIAAEPRDRFATAADMHEAIEPFAAAVRAPSPSRLRVSGTIGVSQIAPIAGLAPFPAPPPPTSGAPASAARPASAVAKTWPPDEAPSHGAPASPRAEVQPPVSLRASGTVVDALPTDAGAPPADRTRRMDAPYAAGGVPAVVPGAPGLGRRPNPRRRSGASALWVVLTAAGVAAVVMGGVYLSSRPSSSKDDDPPRRVSAPTPAVTSEPHRRRSAPAEPPPFVPPTPAVPPPTPRPGPAGPSGPRPRPSPSTAPSAPAPPSPSPLVIPTAFPFPNPFQPAPQPAPSGTPQQAPPPLFPLP